MARRFSSRLLLLVFPFALASGLELFVLPPDAFTFRVWEALTVYRLQRWLPGPFYPGYRIQKVEEGDLGHGTPYTFHRSVLWVTDDRGFRHHSSSPSSPSLVIVGDSFVAGSALSQDEMLSSILGHKLGVEAYAYAPRALGAFVADPRFIQHPPRVVVLALSEISFQFPLAGDQPTGQDPGRTGSNPKISAVLVFIDRLCRANMLHAAQTKVDNLLDDVVARSKGIRRFHNREVLVAGDRSMLFRRYEVMGGELSDGQIAERVQELLRYKDVLARRGTALIVFSIPAKSSVYYRSVPMAPSVGLTRLGQACLRSGIPFISALGAFRAEADGGRLVYFVGDTHWNPEGVSIAAGLLEGRLRALLSPPAARRILRSGLTKADGGVLSHGVFPRTIRIKR